MALPTWGAAGAGATAASGSVSPAYPSGITAGSYLLVQAFVRGSGGALTVPAGWTQILGPTKLGSAAAWQSVYAKKAVGTESGTLAIAMTGGTGAFARMHRFEGVLDDPDLLNTIEAATAGFNTTATNPVPVPSLTTLGADRLGVFCLNTFNNTGTNAATGETGGDWSQPVTEYATASNGGSATGLQRAALAAAGTISGGTVALGAARAYIIQVFALKPVEAPSGEIFVVSQSDGIAFGEARGARESLPRQDAALLAEQRRALLSILRADQMPLLDTSSLGSGRVGQDALPLSDVRALRRALNRTSHLFLSENLVAARVAQHRSGVTLISGRSFNLAARRSESTLLQDRALVARGKAALDSVDLADESSTKREAIARDAALLLDSRFGRMAFARGDPTLLAEAWTLARAKVTRDALPLIDFGSRATERRPTNSMLLFDDRRSARWLPTGDTALLDDRAALLLARFIAIGDQLGLADTARRVVESVLRSRDALPLGDSDRRATARHAADSLPLPDATSAQRADAGVERARIARDHLFLLDGMRREAGLSRRALDQVDLSADRSARVIAISLIDAGLALGDRVTLAAGRILFVGLRDGMVLGEINYRDVALRLSDAVSAPDAVARVMAIELADGVDLEGLRSLGHGRRRLDTVGILDVTALRRGLSVGDDLQLADATGKATWHLLLDLLETADRSHAVLFSEGDEPLTTISCGVRTMARTASSALNPLPVRARPTEGFPVDHRAVDGLSTRIHLRAA